MQRRTYDDDDEEEQGEEEEGLFYMRWPVNKTDFAYATWDPAALVNRLQRHRDLQEHKLSRWPHLITPLQGISTIKPWHSEEVRALPGSASSPDLAAGLAIGSWPALRGGI